MKTWVDTKELDQFRRHWDALFDVFPAAVRPQLPRWARRSGGIWTPISSPRAWTTYSAMYGTASAWRWAAKADMRRSGRRPCPFHDRFGKRKTWKGKTVSGRMVTRWLERGHGARRPSGKDKRYRARIVGAGVSGRRGLCKGPSILQLDQAEGMGTRTAGSGQGAEPPRG